MTKDDIIRMAMDAGISETHARGMRGFLEHFVAIAAAAAKSEEREACAKVCEEFYSIEGIAQDCASAIRARGNT